jgi:hypothetical protein
MSRFRSTRVGLLLGIVSFLVFAATADRGDVSMDVESAEISSWHIAKSGSPWIDDVQLPEFLENSPIRSVWVQETDDGHRVVTRSPGVVAAALPAYFLAQPDEMTRVPAALTAALLSALTLLLMFLALRTRLSTRLALGATLALGFTTPMWAVSANAMWPHTITLLGIAGMAWAAATGRWWAAGLFGAVAIWGRLHTGIIVAMLGLLVGLNRRRPGITLRVGIASAIGLAGVGLWTHWMFRSWNPRAYYGRNDLTDSSMLFSITNQLGMWISPGRGLLVWTPILLVLAPAVVREWRQLPDWSRALVIGALVYTLVQDNMLSFTGGDGFYAYRCGLELVAACTPAFAFSYHRAGRVARALTLPVLAMQLVVIAPGALLDRSHFSQDRAWVANDFTDAIAATGPAAAIVAAALAVLVWILLAAGVRRLPTTTVGASPDSRVKVVAER